MGARLSSDEQIVWLDFEGGVTNPAWDVFMLFTQRNKPAVGVRLCRAYSARQRARLLKDLPKGAQEFVRDDNVVAVRYGDDGSTVKSITVSPHTTVETAVQTSLASTPAAPMHLISWGMRNYDKQALRNCGVEATPQRHLHCGLLFFKHHFVLPKNTMSSRAPGTPRAVFRAPTAGVAHGARADTLHLRAVVERAAHSVASAQGAAASFEHDWDAISAATYFDAVLSKVCAAELPTPAAKAPQVKELVPCMWGELYFDADGKLLKSSSKAFKRRFSEHLRARGLLTKEMQCRVNRTQLASSFQRLLRSTA